MSFKITYKGVGKIHDWEYKCSSCGEEFIVQASTDEMKSKEECKCGAMAHRHISKPPRIELDPISGDHPGATDKWIRMRESKMRQEKKNKENHGTYD